MVNKTKQIVVVDLRYNVSHNPSNSTKYHCEVLTKVESESESELNREHVVFCFVN